jgi:hypothetical protein
MAVYIGDLIKSTDIYYMAKVTVAMLMRQYTFKHLIFIDRMNIKTILD